MIPDELRQRIDVFHKSDAWTKGAWRKKVKLAIKEFQRIEHDFALSAWRSNVTAPLQRPIEDSDKMRVKILNLLFDPLRFYFTDAFQHPQYILTYIPNNRVGNHFTKLGKKRHMFAYVGELHYPSMNKFPITALPLRYADQYLNAGNQISGFWQGMVYAREWNSRKKSAKTLTQII